MIPQSFPGRGSRHGRLALRASILGVLQIPRSQLDDLLRGLQLVVSHRRIAGELCIGERP